jgi:hypothetical protein
MRPTNLRQELFLDLLASLKSYETSKARVVNSNHVKFEVGARIDQRIELEIILKAERRGESKFREKTQCSYKA